jgi:heme A synthase
MTPDVIFKLCSTLALFGWIILIIGSAFVIDIDKYIIGTIVTILCITYAWLIFGHFRPMDIDKFSTLNGIIDLLKQPHVAVAGWVHYLAFDLLTGTWIKRNAVKYNIAHVATLPCLLLTFMLGPVGLLLYLIIRLNKTKKYFAEV